jgi:transketolase
MAKTQVNSPLQTIESTDEKATREGFGAAMVELGHQDENVIVLTADLGDSLKLIDFRKTFPERFYQSGVAEANMMSIAAGLTIGGKVPFACTFANFATGRVFDQVRQSIAYSNKNVKICASHAGLTLGEDGASHQILEDIGLMRMLPNMTVINPCDYNQTRAATIAAASHKGPVYVRFGRPKMPVFTDPDQSFEIGKAWTISQGTDVSIFATGHLVWKAIEAGKQLEEQGINPEIINIHTIKPLDRETIVASARKTGCVVTAEEHQKHGGLGSAISELLIKEEPVPLKMVAVDDMFGESGKPYELMTKYHIDTTDVYKAAEDILTLNK